MLLYKLTGELPDVYKYPVLILAGGSQMFVDYFLNGVKSTCEGKVKHPVCSAILEEFGEIVEIENKTTGVENYSLTEFIEKASTPKFRGRWLCIHHYTGQEKEDKQLAKYCSKPSKYGRLVIVVHNYREYAKWLKNSALVNSQRVCLIELSFPTREVLEGFIHMYLPKSAIADEAIDLFIRRVGKHYDEYPRLLTEIADKGLTKIVFEQMFQLLKGIDFYEPLDLVSLLTHKSTARKVKQTYKVLSSLLADYGADELVKKLKYQIKQLCYVRVEINLGHLPINIPYSYRDIEPTLSKEVQRLSKSKLRELAKIASELSLEDWLYMYQLLDSCSTRLSKERVLMALVTRRDLKHTQLLEQITSFEKI